MCGFFFFFFFTPEAPGPLHTGKRGLTGPSVPSFHPLQSCPQHRRQQRGRQSYRARSSSILFIDAASFKKQAQERGWGGSASPPPPCFPDSFGFPSCERQCPLAKNELLGTPAGRLPAVGGCAGSLKDSFAERRREVPGHRAQSSSQPGSSPGRPHRAVGGRWVGASEAVC